MRTFTLLCCIALASACGGRERQVVAACEQAVSERMGDRPYLLDTDAMRISLRTDANGVSSVRGRLRLNPGLSGEQHQTVECSARFEEGQREPMVISLNFIW